MSQDQPHAGQSSNLTQHHGHHMQADIERIECNRLAAIQRRQQSILRQQWNATPTHHQQQAHSNNTYAPSQSPYASTPHQQPYPIPPPTRGYPHPPPVHHHNGFGPPTGVFPPHHQGVQQQPGNSRVHTPYDPRPPHMPPQTFHPPPTNTWNNRPAYSQPVYHHNQQQRPSGFHFNVPQTPAFGAPPMYTINTYQPPMVTPHTAGHTSTYPQHNHQPSMLYTPITTTANNSGGYQKHPAPSWALTPPGSSPAPWTTNKPSSFTYHPQNQQQQWRPTPISQQAPLPPPTAPPAAKPPRAPPATGSKATTARKTSMKNTTKNGLYGSGTTFTFSAAQPGNQAQRKKLTQATLGQTMTKWRSNQTNPTEQGAKDEDSQDVDEWEMDQELEEVEVGEDQGCYEQQRQDGGVAPPLRTAIVQPSPVPSNANRTMSNAAASSLHMASVLQIEKQERHRQAQQLLCAPLGEVDGTERERWTWLKDRKDAQGRDSSHPLYDPSTLLLSDRDFERLRGFNRQYWSIKKDCMDLVLFVRVGSFYELYDSDADIGLRAGLAPMGTAIQPANMWKVGCSAKAFSIWAAKVLALGYSVGRVEEVGTKKSGAGQLVPRNLVQIYTPGTLLDVQMTESIGVSQPFIALYEGVNGFFGACAVDVASSLIGIAQWQEPDASRSVLSTLLTQVNPIEIVVSGPGSVSLDTKKAIKRHKPLVTDGIERKVTVTQLRKFALPHDPDNSLALEPLLRQTEAVYFALGGNEASFASISGDLSQMSHAAAALQMAVHHLKATAAAQHVLPTANIQQLAAFTPEGARFAGQMLLDATALQTLEILEGSLGGKQGSLLEFLESGVRTAGGRRKLRAWLSAPLYRVADINERLDTVVALMHRPDASGEFQAAMYSAPDCERLLPRVAALFSSLVDMYGADAHLDSATNDALNKAEQASDEDMIQAVDVKQARFDIVLKLLKGLNTLLEAVNILHSHFGDAHASQLPPVVRALAAGAAIIEPLSALQEVFSTDLFSDPTADIILGKGVCEEYDQAALQVQQAEEQLDVVFLAEKQTLADSGATAAQLKKVKLLTSGDDTLLEVPLALKPLLPTPKYSLVKETKTVARFHCSTLSTAAETVKEAKTKSKVVVFSYLDQVSELFLTNYTHFLDFTSCMSTLDVLAGFSEATHPDCAPRGCSFSRPCFESSSSATHPVLDLKGLWSPQLLLSEGRLRYNRSGNLYNPRNGQYIHKSRDREVSSIQANDLLLGGATDPTFMLVTGANSGGKSTLLRSACIATVMAQIGCFVPCSAATLSPVDRIFTRIGAHDRISAGESTFCVEMTETSAILRHAQRSSLVVLDEIGRGTSTFDGYAIAYAVTNYLAQDTNCRTMLATHYHALAKEVQESVASSHMATTVDHDNGLLVPLYRLASGPAPKGSCGIQVAQNTGLPSTVINRAVHMATTLERTSKQQEINYNNNEDGEYDLLYEAAFEAVMLLIQQDVTAIERFQTTLMQEL